MQYRFDNGKVAVVGDAILDRYWFGATRRTSPEAPVPVVSLAECENRLGGAGNVVMNIRELGGACELFAIVGEDDAGDDFQRLLEASDITNHVVACRDGETVTKLRVLSQQQQLIRLDRDVDYAVGAAELLGRFKQRAVDADVLILSDYRKGTLQYASAYIEWAKQQDKMVIVDPQGGDFSAYKGATVIVPNYKEFVEAVGPCDSEQQVEDKGKALIAELDIKGLLITRGDKGMTLVWHDKQAVTIPTTHKDVYDVTGAGDTVIGVFALGLANGYTTVTAMRLANAAAGVVVTKLGTARASIDELMMTLNQQQNLTQLDTGCVSLDALQQGVSKAKALGEKVVMTNGCFDLLHAGHVSYLQRAKQFGDRLLVAVNDDASIKRLKGESRPVMDLATRKSLLNALGVVDWVIEFSEDTPENLLHMLQPDVLVKGGDYKSVDEVVGAEIVFDYGGSVHVIDHPFTHCSTTNIIEKAKEN